jgi:hypothetical protein
MDASGALGFLQKALPWIGAAATGNVPALVGLAANAVGNALGKPIEADSGAIMQAVANASPEEILKLKIAEDELKAKMQALGFAHEEEMAKLGIEEQQIYIGDTSDARHQFSTNSGVYRLGVVILGTFAGLMGAVLYECYRMIEGGMQIKDPGTVAVIFTLIGTIVGYLASNAQQVVNFFFGSSHGSQAKTDSMSQSIVDLSAQLKNKNR